MLHIEPKEITVREVHRLLLGGVGPRPIALVSTISKEGILNLTPFSFFNVSSSFEMFRRYCSWTSVKT